MSEPFLSEIRIMSFGYAPRGWALCNGQLLPINQNQALFSLLGTTYGGNGQTNFALPDLRGRAPIHVGQGFLLGQRGGEEIHTLSQSEMPQHLHFAQGSSDAATTLSPSGNNLLAKSAFQLYGQPTNLGAMVGVNNVGGSQAHQNQQPYLTLSFCIALQGIFPSQN
jgi:microcystin-dependent protein